MKLFHRFATIVTNLCGTPYAFMAMVLVILICDSATVDHIATVVTTLMAFVIQHTQNRDTPAIQKKLDEIIKGVDKADDALQGIEKD